MGLLLVLCIIRAVFTFYLCVESARVMHTRMFKAFITSTTQFLDTMQPERILTRFSKDMEWMDDLIPGAGFGALVFECVRVCL